MDPISIVGIAGTAYSVVDRVAKIINLFLKLSTRFRTTNAKVTSLIGYLASLNASVSEIAGIVEGLSDHERYRELASSLGTTLHCTTTSMSFLESMITALKLDSRGEMSKLNKISILLKSEEFDEYLKGINIYVNALNLHLNALQSRSLLEQRGVLNSVDAQQLMTAIKDETSSLFCLADNLSATSQRTRNTELSMALDMSFEFDSQILSTRIYTAAYRSHLRQAITARKMGLDVGQMPTETAVSPVSDSGVVEQPHAEGTEIFLDTAAPFNNILVRKDIITKIDVMKTEEIMQESEVQAQPRARNRWMPKSAGRASMDTVAEGPPAISPSTSKDEGLKCLLLGASESGKSTLLKAINLYEGKPYTLKERNTFRTVLLSHVVHCATAVLDAMKHFQIPLDSDANEWHVGTIYMQCYDVKEDSAQEIKIAIEVLKHDKGFQEALRRRSEYQLADHADL